MFLVCFQGFLVLGIFGRFLNFCCFFKFLIVTFVVFFYLFCLFFNLFYYFFNKKGSKSQKMRVFGRFLAINRQSTAIHDKPPHHCVHNWQKYTGQFCRKPAAIKSPHHCQTNATVPEGVKSCAYGFSKQSIIVERHCKRLALTRALAKVAIWPPCADKFGLFCRQ